MRKKVFIALRMSGIAGQEKLAGIFRWLGNDHEWDATLVRTAAEFSPSRVQNAIRGGYDGFIVSIPDTEETASLLAATKIPTVVMDIHDPSLSARRSAISFIRNSPAAIGAAAADFLVATGRCRSYAFMQNPSVAEWSVDRCRAFRSALRDRGFRCLELSSPAEIERLEKPAGVFAANDDCGFDTIEYCRSRRWRVPEDVLVLGTNNEPLICENARPALSSIQPDFEEEGYLAAKTLALMMDGGAAPREILVGVKTIARRASTADVSPSGKLVQKALAYVRRHALHPIRVDDVARHLGCSRRLADLRFRELQGSSIGETIIAIRLDEVKRRLATTRDPIDKIAADCGYDTPNSLKNLFKRRFGMSMRDWRARQSGGG